jgi:hypothetical protein
MVVDAYCPECRGDLSLPPLPDGTGGHAGEASPETLLRVSRGLWWGLFTVGAAVAAIVYGIKGQWDLAGGGALGVVMFGALAYVNFRPTPHRTRVTGREKMREHPE